MRASFRDLNPASQETRGHCSAHERGLTPFVRS
jgi:hypothetical protein